MSYIALARKWRPKKFSELVGQTNVMQALANALDSNRLHHAYLFTGTRGVGKTTIARIFSKALNCEQGISSQPCGVCSICKSIDEGRFIDLIEVDAASRTKVEDTREILDNVQYAPSQGRYKVYLIDEVHMLSKSSFNALLKTLEEPPEHVKFLLATTDPHKLPVTVLSRCLQFNLMRLTRTQIQDHLAHILQQENIPYDNNALSIIAKSADGSARDSLSLLDQAIAYGDSKVREQDVEAMLGLVNKTLIQNVLEAVTSQSVSAVKQVIIELAKFGVDYDTLLENLIESFYEISQYQILNTFVQEPQQQTLYKKIAQNTSSQKIQMLYQIALLARQDMKLVPDNRIGFEMALLRMVAFKLSTIHSINPDNTTNDSSNHITQDQAKDKTVEMSSIKEIIKSNKTLPSSKDIHHKKVNTNKENTNITKLEEDEAPIPFMHNIAQKLQNVEATPTQNIQGNTISQNVNSPTTQESPKSIELNAPNSFTQKDTNIQENKPFNSSTNEKIIYDKNNPLKQWLELIKNMQLNGIERELAKHCQLLNIDTKQYKIELSIDVKQLNAKTNKSEELLEAAIKNYFGQNYQLIFKTETKTTDKTPNQYQEQQQLNKQQQAYELFISDPFIKEFEKYSSTKIIESSIKNLT